MVETTAMAWNEIRQLQAQRNEATARGDWPLYFRLQAQIRAILEQLGIGVQSPEDTPAD